MVSKAVDRIEVERTVVSKNWRKDIEGKGKEGCREHVKVRRNKTWYCIAQQGNYT